MPCTYPAPAIVVYQRTPTCLKIVHYLDVLNLSRPPTVPNPYLRRSHVPLSSPAGTIEIPTSRPPSQGVGAHSLVQSLRLQPRDLPPSPNAPQCTSMHAVSALGTRQELLLVFFFFGFAWPVFSAPTENFLCCAVLSVFIFGEGRHGGRRGGLLVLGPPNPFCGESVPSPRGGDAFVACLFSPTDKQAADSAVIPRRHRRGSCLCFPIPSLTHSIHSSSPIPFPQPSTWLHLRSAINRQWSLVLEPLALLPFRLIILNF
jgi:hypothetical protein